MIFNLKKKKICLQKSKLELDGYEDLFRRYLQESETAINWKAFEPKESVKIMKILIKIKIYFFVLLRLSITKT
jgi:hypothetical protein